MCQWRQNASSTPMAKAHTKARQQAPATPSQAPPSRPPALSSFSSNGLYFASTSSHAAQDHIRVDSVITGVSVAEYVIHLARITALSWLDLDPRTLTEPTKRRNKHPLHLWNSNSPAPCSQVLAVGLSNGECRMFHPAYPEALTTLARASTQASILSMSTAPLSANSGVIWTSCSDGTVEAWDAQKKQSLGGWKADGVLTSSLLAVRRCVEGRTDLILAEQDIRMFSAQSNVPTGEERKLSHVCTFTGHTSSVKYAEWVDNDSAHSLLLSVAEADRSLRLWALPDGTSTLGKLVASLFVDSDIRHASVATTSGTKAVLVLSAASKISIAPIPHDLGHPPAQKKTAALEAQATVHISPQGECTVLAGAFIPDAEGQVVLACSNGEKIGFYAARYLDADGEYIAEVCLDINSGAGGIGPIFRTRKEEDSSPQEKYTNPDAVASGADTSTRENKTDKLRELTVHAHAVPHILAQALQSSDILLLDKCLAHSDHALIQTAVRALPQAQVVPLLNACLERLAKSTKASAVKARSGGASSQREARAIAWVGAILAIHNSYIMSMPEWVARLAGLHTRLTKRRTLQERLLSTSGRLELLLSQVELRGSAPSAQQNVKLNPKAMDIDGPRRDAEDSSDDGGDAEVEVDDDEGSVEDVELGGESPDEEVGDDDEENEEEPNDEEEEKSNEEGVGQAAKAFMDDLPEEDSESEGDESDNDSE